MARLCVVENSTNELDAGTLIVDYIDTERDSRDPEQRPRARDVYASFWVHQAGRSLERLRRIQFQTVVESSTRDAVRDYVCLLMGVAFDQLRDAPWEDMTLRASSPSNSKPGRAWRLLCERSKLVRSARGVLRDYPDTAPSGERLDIVQIDIHQAYDRYGERSAFDLDVTFGDREVQRTTT